jgi:outer membrane immunogenic protein
MRQLLAYSVGLVGLLGSAAMAADLHAPVYKAPPAPPVATDIWNGFYGGLNAGIGIARNSTNDTTVATPGQLFPTFDVATFNHAPVDGVFGVQAGWNWHAAPSWVLGVEADWQWSGQSESVCSYGCLPAASPGALLAIEDQQSIKWFGTARGRIGWLTSGGSLLYATGGAAWARVDQTLTLTGTPLFFATGTTSQASFSETKLGWAVGAGIESPLADRWSLKAEYLLVGFNGITNSLSTPLDPGLAPSTTQLTTSSVNIRDHIVRLGLNYHFDGGSGLLPAAPAPMYYKAPPLTQQGWSGFYVGANGGGAIARNPTTDTTIVPGSAFPVFGADTFTHAPIGGVLGGQIGFNWRASPNWVLGAEADWQWTNQTDSACISLCLPAGAPTLLLGAINDQSLKWFGTARARAGWVAPNGSLLYATGGAAWGGSRIR